jgi:hypothetical protein
VTLVAAQQCRSFRVFFYALKYPAHTAKEAASRPELRRENLNSCAIPQLITLIEQVGDIKSDADLAVFFRQVKLVQESDIDRIIAGKFIRICEPASQAASIQKIRVHGGVFAGVGSTRGNRIPLVMIQKNVVIANEVEFVRAEKELTGNDLFSEPKSVIPSGIRTSSIRN